MVGTWRLFRQSLHLLFDGVPDQLDLREVQALLQSLPGVTRVHDLHVWAMGTSQVALTAHLAMPDGPADDAFLAHATGELHRRFGIEHVTLQAMRVPFTASCGPAAPEAINRSSETSERGPAIGGQGHEEGHHGHHGHHGHGIHHGGHG